MEYKLIETEMNFLAKDICDKWKILNELLTKSDFELIMGKKKLDNSLRPKDAIKVLIESSKVEYTFKNKVKVFQIGQLKTETVEEFHDRLKKMILATNWDTSKAKGTFYLPVKYWKNENLRQIMSILINFEINITTPTSIKSFEMTCYKCREIGHIALYCPVKNTNTCKKTPSNVKYNRFTRTDKNSISKEIVFSHQDQNVLFPFIIDTESQINCFNYMNLEKFKELNIDERCPDAMDLGIIYTKLNITESKDFNNIINEKTGRTDVLEHTIEYIKKEASKFSYIVTTETSNEYKNERYTNYSSSYLFNEYIKSVSIFLPIK
ncbi:hypothetical protein A3Q56_01319 [Intoshia linei]|uniref:CCHC-type domain-containing protein n=1 Tax=Intoshia linei TaxID=1819745 RepID=A0A177BBD9_9BILA|nr:hypothetical protein A3Q56_01319 [Intoshia linei]